MILRNQYAIQPYLVGPKDRKSLVIGIPAAFAKAHSINQETIFILEAEKTNKLILMKIQDNKPPEAEKNLIPVDRVLKDSSQQAFSQET